MAQSQYVETQLPNGVVFRQRREKYPPFTYIDVVKGNGDIMPMRRDRERINEWEDERRAVGELIVIDHLSEEPNAPKVQITECDGAGNITGHRAVGITRELKAIIDERQAVARERSEASARAYGATDRKAAAAAATAGAAAGQAVAHTIAQAIGQVRKPGELAKPAKPAKE